ncbi:hypothetical protein Sjap_002496 [Stephania japonica]|uniref:Uncharacterized protein n=1 Tax=Stephania japonica TaxID=461633 RepID=A0AAP0KLZ4_9MAGN
MGNCFSSQIELIGFAPTETIYFIYNKNRGLFFVFNSEWSSSILFIGTGR